MDCLILIYIYLTNEQDTSNFHGIDATPQEKSQIVAHRLKVVKNFKNYRYSATSLFVRLGRKTNKQQAYPCSAKISLILKVRS